MTSINEKGVVAKLPAVELMTSLQAFLEPVLGQLPEVRLQEVTMLAMRGILAGQSPIIAEMARGGRAKSASNWPLAKRFYGDSGLDDQKIFAQVTRVNSQFVFCVKHADRLVEVYNESLQCWEGPEHLSELAASVPWSLNVKVAFHHAHKTRHTTVSLGWLVLRLPPTQLRLWALVAYDTDLDRSTTAYPGIVSPRTAPPPFSPAIVPLLPRKRALFVPPPPHAPFCPYLFRSILPWLPTPHATPSSTDPHFAQIGVNSR